MRINFGDLIIGDIAKKHKFWKCGTGAFVSAHSPLCVIPVCKFENWDPESWFAYNASGFPPPSSPTLSSGRRGTIRGNDIRDRVSGSTFGLLVRGDWKIFIFRVQFEWLCGCGEIGLRACFRRTWEKSRGGSSPLTRTKKCCLTR